MDNPCSGSSLIIRMDEDIDIKDRRRCSGCSCKIKTVVLILLLVLCFVAGVFFERKFLNVNKPKQHVGPQPEMAYLTINPSHPGIKCKGVGKIDIEAKDCSFPFKSSVNFTSACYNCGDTCYSFEDLLPLAKKKSTKIPNCTGDNRISCCLLMYLGNMINDSGTPEKKYACYPDMVNGKDMLVPTRDRPADDLVCTCTQSPYCGQEKMADCEKLDHEDPERKCLMNINRTDKHNSCTCHSPTSVDELDTLSPCMDDVDQSSRNGGHAGQKQAYTADQDEPLKNGFKSLQCLHAFLMVILVQIMFIGRI